ncbi:MAG: hypothetical protein MZU97_02110 [Bacillus subtilis]|nr:hypothetical protein [Bacillus subtilis]
MSKIIRAGLLQTKTEYTKQENIDKAIAYIEQAANQGVQVLSMQELFFSLFCDRTKPRMV